MTTTAIETSATGIADRLKAETSAAHRDAESRGLQKQLIKATIALDDLAGYLAQLRLVHAALEAAMDDHAEAGDPRVVSVWGDGLFTRHSQALAADVGRLSSADLAVLSVTSDVVATIQGGSAVETIGAYYVLEGSMNGNRFIAMALARAGVVTPPPTYLSPYGDDQPTTWAEFRDRLNALTLSAEEADAMVAAAQAMFAGVAAVSDAVLDTPAR